MNQKLCNNCRVRVIRGHKRTRRPKLSMKIGDREKIKFLKEPELKEEKLYHSNNLEEMPNWDLCPWCGGVWSGEEKIIFINKNCYTCSGSVPQMEYKKFYNLMVEGKV